MHPGDWIEVVHLSIREHPQRSLPWPKADGWQAGLRWTHNLWTLNPWTVTLI